MTTVWQLKHSQLITCPDGTVLSIRRSAITAGGPTCLLIHGFGDGSHVWTHTVQSLDETCAIVTVDLRGHGESAWSCSRDYTVKAHVNDLMHVIGELQLKDLILVGHSLGGQIAIHLTAAHPDRVRGLALLDFGPDINITGMLQARQMLRDSLRLYTSRDDYQTWLIRSQPLIVPAAAELLAATALRPCDDGFRLKIDPALADSEAHTHKDPREEKFLWQALNDFFCPVLVVRGAGSAVLSRSVAAQMQRTIRNSTLHVINGAGHAVMLDNPDQTSGIVSSFVTQLIASGGRLPGRAKIMT